MPKHLLIALLVSAATCTFYPATCEADVRLPKILGSNMVLQRSADVKIWGWADAGEEVRVTGDWFDSSARAVADADGNWQVSIKTASAGGPHTLTIVGKNRISLDKILFGEVWIASGQSNMEMPVAKFSGTYSGIKNFEQEIAAADHPEIRLFQAGNFSSKEPLDDVQPGVSMYGVPVAKCRWKACSPKTIPAFASTAYFFARELHKKLQVPIGIIDSSWGGTRIESWMPSAGLRELGYTAELKQTATLPQNAGQKIPTRLYNGMIHPLRHVTIGGVVWYQGEQNAAQADKYGPLFATMIGEWRKTFGHDFPFYFAQAAPYNYRGTNAAYLREAQFKTMSLPKTGMAVTLDIGNLKDVHPKNKQEVGRRLALWALAKDYGQKIVCSGPIYQATEFKNGKARIHFSYIGGGLTTRDGRSPNGFEIAGADKVFHPATALIDGDRLVVSSDDVAEPMAVRYAFTSQGMGNLTNKEGLPASSFRTDRW